MAARRHQFLGSQERRGVLRRVEIVLVGVWIRQRFQALPVSLSLYRATPRLRICSGCSFGHILTACSYALAKARHASRFLFPSA